MRPERLELEGFTAFRDRTVVEFGDADLFALVGPTGSGKSSIVDAITFALYGSIPRLPKGRVEPIISLGVEEARIRLDFSVGGEQHTAVRIVKRTKSGATTPEARLEGPGLEVVGAREVTDAVEQLLGLTFEHFTKSVVLPQGAFAAFLLDGPADRQALLRQLLDLGRYGRVRDLAKHRARASELSAEGLRGRLAELEGVTPEAIATLEASIAELEELSEWMSALREWRDRQRSERDEFERAHQRAAELAKVLASVEVPADVAQLAGRVEAAKAARVELAEQQESLRTTTAKLAESAPDQEEAAEIASALAAIGRVEELASRIARGREMIEDATSELSATREAAAAAETARRRAAQALDDLVASHRAHVVRVQLSEGDDCPVCGGVVTGTAGPAPVGLAAAAEAVEEARRSEAELGRRQAAIEARLATLTEQLETLTSERDKLEGLVGDRTRDSLERSRSEMTAAAEALAESRATLDELDRRIDAADRDLRSAEDDTTESWARLDALRVALTELDPPALIRRDLAAEWDSFAEWCRARLSEGEERRSATQARLASLTTEEQERLAEARRRVVAAGVDLEPGADPHDAVVGALARAGERLDRMRADHDSKRAAAAQLEGYESDMAVANALVRHLNVNGFERWLVEEVLVELVVLANGLLDQLTGGTYSLVVDGADFLIVDHLNADERRSAMTLSGGETFVVSLALALSLAEQITSMSVTGTAVLESVFLDEGFGTLDPETLDTVAAVIHELGSSGRTVGLITHVAELAEQIPVRFRVTKRAGSSSVERVET